MNIVLWIVQGLLAAMFMMAGFMKLSLPKAELKEKVGSWVEDLSDSQLKLVGLLELLGAIGLVLPMAINVLPVLSPVAALGLGLTMIGALILHLKRKEGNKVAPNIILFALSIFVVIGRFVILPII